MKKLIAMLLVLVMVLGLAACAAKTESPAETKAETPAETATEAPAAEEGKQEETKEEEIPAWKVEHPGWLCEEKTNLSVLTYDGVNSTYPAPSNDLPFWQFMEDYTNVHIDWEVVTYTGYTDIITARLAGGADLADIVMLYKTDIANDAGRNGMVNDLTPYWDSCFTNMQNYFDAAGVDYKNAISNEDGSCYGITTFANPIENHIVLLYNTLWMEKLGAKIPETLDEFTALLEQMQEAGDLNGNGEADEIVFTAADIDHVRSIFNPTFNMEQYQSELAFSADENGVVYDQYTTDNMKAELAYLNDLYARGLLDQEICNMSYDALSEKVASDRVGVFAIYSSFAISYGKLTTAGQEDKTGEWYTIGLPLSSEWCEEPFFVQNESFDSMLTGISASCENPELAAKWLDTLYADEKALEVRTLGFEGKNFNYINDGADFELIMPEDGSNWSIVKLGCGQLALPYVQTTQQLMASKKSTPWYIEEYANIRNNYDWRNHTIVPVPTYNDYESELKDMYSTDVETGWVEYRDKFITGQLDTEKDWDSFVQTLNNLGLPQMIEVFQSVYNRTSK